MAIKLRKKRGDTLVEVMLAVGIFSMVAVAIVSVMSGGTSSSQTALETTLAREEIDNQAEALRFIQQSYIADVRTGSNSPYGRLWKAITDKAYNAGSTVDVTNLQSEISQYHPNTCKELYEPEGEASRYGFIIDPRGFVGYETEFLKEGADQEAALDKILRYNRFTSSGDAEFTPLAVAETYPHLIYNTGGATDHTTDLDTELISDTSTAIGGVFYKAQGIYIIAVKDPNETALANSKSTSDDSAYYDFYIRTCWFGIGDQAPSSISTVIRLYNPDVTTDTSTDTH